MTPKTIHKIRIDRALIYRFGFRLAKTLGGAIGNVSIKYMLHLAMKSAISEYPSMPLGVALEPLEEMNGIRVAFITDRFPRSPEFFK